MMHVVAADGTAACLTKYTCVLAVAAVVARYLQVCLQQSLLWLCVPTAFAGSCSPAACIVPMALACSARPCSFMFATVLGVVSVTRVDVSVLAWGPAYGGLSWSV